MPSKNIKYLLHIFVLTVGSALVSYKLYLLSRVFFQYSEMFPLLLLLIICSLLLFFFSYILTRQVSRAGLLTTIFVLGLYFNWIVYLLIVGCSLLGILISAIVERKTSLDRVHIILNLVSILVVGYFSVGFFQEFVAVRNAHLQPALPEVIPGEFLPGPHQDLPDIYYIILDGYGQAEMLQKLHGIDNSGFIAELESRGFHVAKQSKSNYPKTILSLTSSLNMQYLDPLSTSMVNSNLWWPLTNLLQYSQARQFLEKNGYNFINIASDWDFTNIRNADEFLKPFPIMLNDLQKTFILNSNLRYLGNIRQPLVSFPSHGNFRKIIQYGFQQIPETTSLGSPKFVFVHILAPHPPFVFTETGDPINPEYSMTLNDKPSMFNSLQEYRQSYYSELKFINRQTIDAIDKIMARSATPPIIILQADHGPSMLGNYDELDEACLYERYSILNAYYLPGFASLSIPEDVSPVNSFRLVFNLYFGTDLELLPDLMYFSPIGRMYRFTNVTSQGDNICSTTP